MWWMVPPRLPVAAIQAGSPSSPGQPGGRCDRSTRGPVRQADTVGPLISKIYALMPYIGLAISVGAGARAGLDIAGDALARVRLASHTAIGLLLTAGVV